MIDLDGLQQLRSERYFDGWDGFVKPEMVEQSDESVRQLIDDVIDAGPGATEETVRAAVARCVERFNALDDGWICTIERDDIFEQVGRAVELCGFDYDEDWLGGRDW